MMLRSVYNRSRKGKKTIIERKKKSSGVLDLILIYYQNCHDKLNWRAWHRKINQIVLPVAVRVHSSHPITLYGRLSLYFKSCFSFRDLSRNINGFLSTLVLPKSLALCIWRVFFMTSYWKHFFRSLFGICRAWNTWLPTTYDMCPVAKQLNQAKCNLFAIYFFDTTGKELTMEITKKILRGQCLPNTSNDFGIP